MLLIYIYRNEKKRTRNLKCEKKSNNEKEQKNMKDDDDEDNDTNNSNIRHVCPFVVVVVVSNVVT